MAKQSEKRWFLDREIEELTEKRITASRLRKDRLGKQLFPFHRIGKSCFYDITEINELIERSRFGGNVGSITRATAAGDGRRVSFGATIRRPALQKETADPEGKSESAAEESKEHLNSTPASRDRQRERQ